MANNQKPLYGRNSYGANRVLGTPKLDPFGNNRENPLDAVLPTSPDVVRKVRDTYENAIPVMFPRTMAAPEGARTINFLKGALVAAGATVDLFSFTAKPGSTTVFYSYDLFTDIAVPVPGVLWLPKMDGARCLQFHGDPSTPANDLNLPNEIVSLGFAGEAVTCQILMEPGQIFNWQVVNNTPGPVFMGVRLSGYLDMSQRLTSSKFGD